jgi:hypothetical protein
MYCIFVACVIFHKYPERLNLMRSTEHEGSTVEFLFHAMTLEYCVTIPTSLNEISLKSNFITVPGPVPVEPTFRNQVSVSFTLALILENRKANAGQSKHANLG